MCSTSGPMLKNVIFCFFMLRLHNTDQNVNLVHVYAFFLVSVAEKGSRDGQRKRATAM